MARRPASSIDAVVQEAMEDVVARASASIARAVADLAAERLSAALEASVPAKSGRRGARRRVAPRGEITRWAADRRARRVPNFVIDLTGLETKKQIVQKYGNGAVFEKGKPAPRAR